MDDVSAWLDRYLRARSLEMEAGRNPDGPEMAGLLDAFSPEARYFDMPSGKSWQGADELRGMYVTNYNWANDQEITYARTLVIGREFVLEGVSRGTNNTALGERGRAYALPFACLGSFDDDGRVEEQRDYWDLKSFLVQIGADPPLQ